MTNFPISRMIESKQDSRPTNLLWS